ncbi:hypothetical protein SAY87_030152 [Trapa incisa]|uniref:Uncharacterized protein n=1 Tax=Trapa incisa TaxID=236973 RepID=A0AAN7K5N9_9MYRT|nr:hypothetical protein SAY87_030152 [Trapa incisa]
MTTYEGKVSMVMMIPAARTVTCNPAGSNRATVVQNDGARTKSEEGAALSADASKRGGNPKDPGEFTMHKTEESRNKCDAARISTPEPGTKSEGQLKGETPSPYQSHPSRD